jgi:hypothetical protein
VTGAAPRMNDEWIARADAGDARYFNSIGNDPAVIDWIAGPLQPPLDLSPVFDDPHNVCLIAQHGFAIFHQCCRGVFELHGAVVPQGRGRWALNALANALDFMFQREAAVVIVAGIPADNRSARGIVGTIGFRLMHVLPDVWPTATGRVPMYVYALLRRNWGRRQCQ